MVVESASIKRLKWIAESLCNYW